MIDAEESGDPGTAFVTAVLAGAMGITFVLPIAVWPIVFPIASIMTGILGGIVGMPLYALALQCKVANGFTAALGGAVAAMALPLFFAGGMTAPAWSGTVFVLTFALAGAAAGCVFWLKLRWRSAGCTDRGLIALSATVLGLAALTLTRL